MKFFKKLFLLIAAVFLLIGCKAINNDLHSLTLELIASGIQFDTENNGQLGFNTYAASPEDKAFAASVGQAGFIYAWGKGWDLSSQGAAIEAALYRCRSYRQKTDPPCNIIAIGNQLVSEFDLIEYSTKVLQIKFLNSGLDGSREGFLSYEPSATQGHIWLVDKEHNRDCKGRWFLNSKGKYLWEIKCIDGLKASGTLTNPLNLNGAGKGRDKFSREVIFIFIPQKE